MPDLSASLATLRSDGHHLRGYLSVYTGSEVLSGTVSSTPANPTTAIAYTLDSGSETDVKPGYRVDILTATGDLKGHTRVRFSGSITSTSMPVRELSKGTIEVESGDLIKVYAEIRLSDKLTTATAALNPDGVTYSDQTDKHRPVACGGGPWAGFVDSGQTYATVQFTGSASYAVDPDTVSALTHSWTFPAGSTPTSSTDADPSAQIPVGNHLIVHTVTDPDNGTSHTQYIPVMVHDDATPPLECLIETKTGDLEPGWTLTAQVFENAALSDIPDGALAVFWLEEFMAGTQQSFGAASTGRNHIKHLGYLRTDTAQGDADNDELRFDLQSPLGALEERFGTSKVFQQVASPSSWQQFRNLTTKRAIIHILKWYTTALDAGLDLIFPSAPYFRDISTSQINLQANSPLAMAREIAAGCDARIVCDKTGRLMIHTRPELIKEANRAAVTRTLTLEDDDIIDYEFRRDHQRPIALYRSRGIIATSAQPAFARWPGDAPGELRQTIIQEKMFFTDLDDLYERTGLRGAAADNVIWQSDNAVLHVSDLEIELFGSYDVVDFYQEYIAFNLTHQNLRGFDWNSILWVLKSADVSYENGTARTFWRLRPATLGPPGVDDTPPSHPISYQKLAPIDLSSLAALPGTMGLTAGTGNLLLALSDGTVAVTTNFSAASPNWTVYDHSGTLGSSVVAYSYQAAAANVSAWLVTATNIYHAANLQDASPTFTNQHTFGDTSTNRNIDSDYTFEPGQHVVVVSGNGAGTSTEAIRSRDGGATWSSAVAIRSSGDDGDTMPAVQVSSQQAGRVWAWGDSSAIKKVARESTDYGATWADWPGVDVNDNCGGILVPYPDRAITVAYVGDHAGGTAYSGSPIGANTNALLRSDFSTMVDISPSVGYGPDWQRSRFCLWAADDDANKLAVVGINHARTNVGVWITANGLSASPSWAELIAPSGSVDYRRCALVNNGQELYVFGANGAIGYSSTPYVPGTIDDKIGDLVTTADVIGIAGF